MSYNLKNRSLLSLRDYKPAEIAFLLKLAADLKAAKYAGTEQPGLKGKEIALIFEKDSTRTRVGFEVAAHDQGATVTYLGPSGSHIGHKESVKDTARVLGRVYDAIEYRGFGQNIVEQLSEFSGVPVYNGLTDQFRSIAIVDEDRSALSRRVSDAIQPPYFQPPVEIDAASVDSVMDSGRYVFVIKIPAGFEADILAGRAPTVQVSIDATAMSQAGNGAVFLQDILSRELRRFVQDTDQGDLLPIDLVVRTRFNPNSESVWYSSTMQVINNITMLSVILCGAALIREREQGTIEQLLVMPVTPTDIVLSKILANGLVIVVAALLSFAVMVNWLMQVPIAGSIPLFILGAVIYQFSVNALGILLATFTNSMQEFGLPVLPILIAMSLLSGSKTPLESMPQWLQSIMQIAPSTHFVGFSQAVRYRAAGLGVVWPKLLAMAVIGAVFFALALLRFRRSVMNAQ